jgi:phage-related protein
MMKLITIKIVKWIGSSRRSLRAFPEDARNLAGNQLWLVQKGGYPDDWKSMVSVGPGAMEIRIHRPHEHRVIYVAKFAEAIYVLHAFEKKGGKTSKKDLQIARAAYLEMERIRNEEAKTSG